MSSKSQYTLPSEDQGAVTLLQNVLKDNLNQAEINTAYDDVSEDYDKVSQMYYKSKYWNAEAWFRKLHL